MQFVAPDDEHDVLKTCREFLISSFYHVLYVVCSLLGNIPASGVYINSRRRDVTQKKAYNM